MGALQVFYKLDDKYANEVKMTEDERREIFKDDEGELQVESPRVVTI